MGAGASVELTTSQLAEDTGGEMNPTTSPRASSDSAAPLPLEGRLTRSGVVLRVRRDPRACEALLARAPHALLVLTAAWDRGCARVRDALRAPSGLVGKARGALVLWADVDELGEVRTRAWSRLRATRRVRTTTSESDVAGLDRCSDGDHGDRSPTVCVSARGQALDSPLLAVPREGLPFACAFAHGAPTDRFPGVEESDLRLWLGGLPAGLADEWAPLAGADAATLESDHAATRLQSVARRRASQSVVAVRRAETERGAKALQSLARRKSACRSADARRDELAARICRLSTLGTEECRAGRLR